MKRFISILAGLLLAGSAWAQQPPPASTPTVAAYQGNELVRLTNNAGSAGQATINHIRNTTGYLVVPTGTTVISNPGWFTDVVLATGAITTWTVNLPNPAPDGEFFTIVNTTGAAFTTNTTVQTQTGIQTQTLNTAYAAQTLAAGSSASWLFTLNSPSSTTGVWYRIR